MGNGGRSCIYFPEFDEDEDLYDEFEAIVSFNSGFVSTVKGVRLSKEGKDSDELLPTLEVNYVNECDNVYWTDAANMDNLFYSDMADFVKRNIDKAITPEEYEALESCNDDDDEND